MTLLNGGARTKQLVGMRAVPTCRLGAFERGPEWRMSRPPAVVAKESYPQRHAAEVAYGYNPTVAPAAPTALEPQVR